MPYSRENPYPLNNLTRKQKEHGVADGYLKKGPNGDLILTPQGKEAGFFKEARERPNKKRTKNDLRIG